MALKLKNFEIGGDKLTILAGPCAIESMDIMRETAEVLKNYDAAILQNHGAIVVGKSIEEAFYKYDVLEYMAQVIILENSFKG